MDFQPDANTLSSYLNFLALTALPDNEIQKQVYQQHQSYMSHPLSQLYLAFILINDGYPLSIRQSAVLTLLTALKQTGVGVRSHVAILKSMVKTVPRALLKQTDVVLAELTKSNAQIDYELVEWLFKNRFYRSVRIVLEDTENTPVILIQIVCRNVINILVPLVGQSVGALAITPGDIIQLLECYNRVIFSIAPQNNSWVVQYAEKVIFPLLLGSQQAERMLTTQELQIRLKCLQGLSSVANTKSMCIRSSYIVFILNLQVNTLEQKKQWVNILIQLIQNDEESRCQTIIAQIVNKVCQYLRFQKEDRRNIQQSMFQEQNIVQEDIDQMNQEQKEEEQEKEKDRGSSLRRISCILIQKVCVYHNDQAMQVLPLTIQTLFASKDIFQIQSGVLIMGIMAQIPLQINPHLLQKIAHLTTIAHPLLRATTLWTLQKCIDLYKNNQAQCEHILKVALQTIYAFANTECAQQAITVPLTQIKLMSMMSAQAALSLIDEVAQKTSLYTMFQLLITTLLTTMKKLKSSKTLSILLKGVTTIFQRATYVTPNHIQCCLRELCSMWASSSHNGSFLCLVLEQVCIICEIAQKNKLFIPFLNDMSKQAIFLIEQIRSKVIANGKPVNVNEINVLVRCLNLLPVLIKQKEQFKYESIYEQRFLLMLQWIFKLNEKDINQFVYPLLICLIQLDIHWQQRGFKTVMEQYSMRFVEIIEQQTDESDMNSVLAYLEVTTSIIKNYHVKTVITQKNLRMVVLMLTHKNLYLIQKKNLTRVFGRLAMEDIGLARSIIQENKTLIEQMFKYIQSVCQNYYTFEAIIGLLLIVCGREKYPKQIISVVETVVTYLDKNIDTSDKHSNEQIIMIRGKTQRQFMQYIHQVRQKMGYNTFDHWIYQCQQNRYLLKPVVDKLIDMIKNNT